MTWIQPRWDSWITAVRVRAQSKICIYFVCTLRNSGSSARSQNQERIENWICWNTNVKNQMELGIGAVSHLKPKKKRCNHRWQEWRGKTGSEIGLFPKDGGTDRREMRGNGQSQSWTETWTSRSWNQSKPSREPWRKDVRISHSPWSPRGDCHSGVRMETDSWFWGTAISFANSLIKILKRNKNETWR